MSVIDDFLKEKGFFIQSNELYGGHRGLYDYLHLGVLLKKKTKALWEDFFVFKDLNVYFVDANILSSYDVWKASGHIDHFNDILVDCRNCKKRFREDHLPLSKECPSCLKNDWTNPKEFNLIFATKENHYLRPETAQSIFINYKNILRLYNPKIPFGVAQIGKSFRNEVTLSNSIFRTKEFEQMELEWFSSPSQKSEVFEKCLEKIKRFLLEELEIPKEWIEFKEISEEDRAHYSSRSVDILFKYEHGWGELWGLADRGNYDLLAHQIHSGKSMEYVDPNNEGKVLAHVIEHSIGVDRLMYAILTQAYTEEKDRIVLKLNRKIAPYVYSVLPLSKEEEELAKKIHRELIDLGIYSLFLNKGSIGKRYRKCDSIGILYCITIDKTSRENLSNPKFTIRDRDTTKQISIDWETFRSNGFKDHF